MSEPLEHTSGYWWTPEDFVQGICRHDSIVRDVETAELPADAPHFLPAPVDLHVHGGGGHDCMTDEAAIRNMLRVHGEHGTGALLATSVTAPFDEIRQFLDNVARVMEQPEPQAASLLGAHLEGPFINPDKLGAQPPFAVPLDIVTLERWLETGVVRIITYAPEIDPDGALLGLCHRYNVRAQIGHTLCTWQTARSALQAGCGVTHLYNAMSGVAHRAGGAAAAALAWASHAEIITDGQHVDRAAFECARRAVPGLYSITDATAAAGMPDGDYRLGSLAVSKQGDRVLLPDGTLAGSCLTQRRSLAVLRGWGLDWHEIGRISSATPANWLGENCLGRIGPGSLASWLEIRDDQLAAVWLSGQRYVQGEGSISPARGSPSNR